MSAAWGGVSSTARDAMGNSSCSGAAGVPVRAARPVRPLRVYLTRGGRADRAEDRRQDGAAAAPYPHKRPQNAPHARQPGRRRGRTDGAVGMQPHSQQKTSGRGCRPVGRTEIAMTYDDPFIAQTNIDRLRSLLQTETDEPTRWRRVSEYFTSTSGSFRCQKIVA